MNMPLERAWALAALPIKCEEGIKTSQVTSSSEMSGFLDLNCLIPRKHFAWTNSEQKDYKKSSGKLCYEAEYTYSFKLELVFH